MTRIRSMRMVPTCLMLGLVCATGMAAQSMKAAPSTATKTLPSKSGTTTITIPNPLFQATVDPANGSVVLPDSTLPILMSHEDQGAFCHKVVHVGVAAQAPYKMFDQHYPAGTFGQLCTFPAGSLTFGGFMRELDRTSFRSACSDRMGAADDSYAYLPIVLKPYVAYNGDGVANKDTLQVQNSRIEVRCLGHRCPAVSLGSYGNASYSQLPDAQPGQSYSQPLFSSGANVASVQASGLPPGMSLGRDGRLTGIASVPGSYRVSFTVTDNCVWKAQSYTGTAALAIKDGIPPRVASLTVTPDTVPYNGASVTVVAQATDNNAVFKVMLTVTKPDASVSNSWLPMTSGTPKDGQWKVSFQTAVNGGGTPQTYTIAVTAFDAENNKAQSPAKMVIVAPRSGPPVPMLRRP